MFYDPTVDTFERFEFQPLDLETFYRHFHHAVAAVDQWYQWWNRDFNWSSCRFYRAQYDRHLTLEFRHFSRSRYLKLSYPEELGNGVHAEEDIEAWQDWLEEAESLSQHRQALHYLLEQYNKPASPVEAMRSSHLVQTVVDQMETGWHAVQRRQAKALWFNQALPAPDAEDLRRRKSMPYDEYLQSSHWRRVRAALMLIERAHCLCCGDASFMARIVRKRSMSIIIIIRIGVMSATMT